MNREPLTPKTEPVGPDGLTLRERSWLQEARRHTAELNQLLAERGVHTRYTVTLTDHTTDQETNR
ncbi:hypothetical protein JBE04_39925 [Streptomyces sp. PRKS01-29]|nr:hypothetical protein [Streptomyces sabulosicollis]MBI0300465.1 hypothetical protein [Streptomyces sabulosicollis]